MMLELRKMCFSASLQTKPSPNETTTPVLKAGGPRHGPLGPGLPGCVALRVSTVWIGLSNPRSLVFAP